MLHYACLNNCICSHVKRDIDRANESEQTRINSLASMSANGVASTRHAIIEASYSFVRARLLDLGPALVYFRSSIQSSISLSHVHLFSHIKSNLGDAVQRDQTRMNNFDQYERDREYLYTTPFALIVASCSFAFVRACPLRLDPASYAYMHILTKLYRMLRWRPRRSFLLIFFLFRSPFVEV